MSAREEFPWPPVGSRAAYVQHEEMCDLIDRLRANQVTPEAQAVLDAVVRWRAGDPSIPNSVLWRTVDELAPDAVARARREAAGGVSC